MKYLCVWHQIASSKWASIKPCILHFKTTKPCMLPLGWASGNCLCPVEDEVSIAVYWIPRGNDAVHVKRPLQAMVQLCHLHREDNHGISIANTGGGRRRLVGVSHRWNRHCRQQQAGSKFRQVIHTWPINKQIEPSGSKSKRNEPTGMAGIRGRGGPEKDPWKGFLLVSL